jgi:hypothetical protein
MSRKHKAVALIRSRAPESGRGSSRFRTPTDALADCGAQIDRWVNEGGAVGPRVMIERMSRTDNPKNRGQCKITR